MSKRQTSSPSCVLILLVLSMLFSGCGSTHLTSTLSIAMENADLTPGSMTQLHAYLTDSFNTMTDVTSMVTWTSANSRVVTVSQAGILTSGVAGSTTVSARYNQFLASRTVAVSHGNIQGLAITPGKPALSVGATQQFAVAATYADKTTADISNLAQWAVKPSSVASISATGLLTATGAGPFALSASAGGQSTSLLGVVAGSSYAGNSSVLSLRITPALASISGGKTQQFTATASFRDGTTSDVSASTTWVSSNTAALTVSSKGFATAVGKNDATATLTATYNGTSTSTTVQVKAPASTSNAKLAALYVKPTSSSIALGTAEQHTALAVYSDKSQRDVTDEVTWGVVKRTPFSGANVHLAHAFAVQAQATAADSNESSDGVVSVDSRGVNTALAAGSSELQATFGALQSTSIVLVTPATPVSLDIRASRDRFPVGAVQQVQLMGTFSDGHTQDLSLTANWKTSNPAIATIDDTGLAMGVAAGDVTFSASFGGLTASTIGYQVLPKTLLSLVIDVGYAGLAVGASEQLTALGTYSDGSTHDLTSLAAWASLSPDIVSSTPSGEIFANGVGTAQITATVGGLQAIVSLSSFVIPLNSIELLPPQPKLARGTTLDLAALGHFANGATVDIAYSAIWTSLDATVLTVNSVGRIKSGKVGKTTVTALAYGVTATTDEIEVTNATLVRLLLQAPASRLAAGTAQRYTAYGVFSDGSFQDVTDDVVWNTSDYTKASVDATGLVRVMRPAVVQVSATMQGVTTSLPLTVSGATIVGVSITPGNSELPVGVIRQYSLIATLSDGTTQDITKGAIWGAAIPSIAGQFVKGQVIGVSAGVGEVHAAYGFFSASTPVNVTNATLTSIALTPASTSIRLGQQQQMVAVGTFSDGYTQNLYLNASYRSANTGIASILDAQALANATGIGSTQITATYRGQASTSQFRVTSNVLQSIAFSPASPSINSGSTEQLTAKGTFDDGVVYDLSKEVTWTSSNPAVLAIDSNGVATASVVTAATQIAVTVVYGSTTASFNVNVLAPSTSSSGGSESGGSNGGVTPAPQLTAITVVPTSAHLAAGTQVQLTVLGTYTDGSRRDVTASSTWASATPATATVDATGLATAVAPGMVQVVAHVGSLSAASTINVSSATLVSVALQASSTPLVAGASQQFALIGTFSDRSQQDLSGSAHWTSSNQAVATVSATGLVTGRSAGQVSITASFNGQTATAANLAVGARQPASLHVTPTSPSFASGTVQMFHVIATYTDSTTQDVTASASFTSSDPGVVRLDGGGAATGVRPGTAQVTVAFAGLSASTQTVTVTNATLLSLALTPSTPQFALGTTQQFTAIGMFSDSSTQNLSSEAVWTSSNSAVLTIDGNGLATGTSTGSAQVVATLQGVSATTGAVQVTPATLVSVSIMPMHPAVAAGTGTQVTVVGRFFDGTTQSLTSTATFTSSDTSVLTAGANGMLNGVAPGTANLTVTVDGIVQTTSITVSNATLVSLAIAPANPVPFAVGRSEQFTLTGTFSDGSTQDLSSSATWTSSNDAVVTVDSHGLALGTGTGSATISASFQGQTSTTGSVQVTPATQTSLSVTPMHGNITVGATQQFTATVTNSDGTIQDVTTSATWSSTSNVVATVDATGLATGTGAGNATITAQWSGVSSNASLAVSSATVTMQSIAVSPYSSSIGVGATQQMYATASYSDGSTQDLTNSVSWTSSNTGVATVSASGLATAVGSGSVTITAMNNGVSGTATITVAPNSTPTPATLQTIAVSPSSSSIAYGATQQFHATGTYTDGSTQDLTTSVSWATSASSVASIDANGLAQANSSGVATLTATSVGVSASANLTVGAAPLVSITVTPANISLATGTTQQYTATGQWADGSTQDITSTVTWTSTATSVASITAGGLAMANAQGTTTIEVRSGSVTASTNLSVTAATVVHLEVSPSPASVAAGGVTPLVVVANFSDGTSQNVTGSATYTSSNPGVVSISSDGTLRGTSTGSATVQIALGNSTITLNVTTTPATLTGITITPANTNLAAGMSQQFTATGTFSDGSTQDLTNTLAWATSAASVATVNPTGNVTVQQGGQVTITATEANGTIGSITLTTTNAVVTTIAVTPGSASLAAGQSRQFAATATLSDGSQQDLTTSVHWSVSNAGTATVSNTVGSNGLLSTTAAGNVTVAATVETISGQASVTVSAAQLASVAVSPAALSLPAGTTSSLSVIGTYTDGSSASLTNVATYTVDNAWYAVVSSTGVVRSMGTGSTTIHATVQGVSGSVALTVTPATLSSIVLAPASPSVAAGLALQLNAVGTYSDGSTVNLNSQVQWTSSDATVATVSTVGSLHTLRVGSAAVTATLNGITQTVPVNVTPAVLQTIVVQAAATSLPAGLSTQLTATGSYSDGSTQDLTSAVTWSSQTPSTGLVSSTGVARALQTGSLTALASLGGVQGTITLTITAPLLQSITLSPANRTVINLASSAFQYTATGSYSDGTTANITNSVHWQIVSGASVGSISQSGRFSTVGIGTGVVSASSGAVNGTTHFTVISVL